MKRFLGLVSVILFSAVRAGVCEGQVLPDGRYFGQDPPGFAPEVFAPDMISLPDRYEYCLTFSPSLDECVYGVTNAGWGGFNLWFTKMGSDSTWIDPIPAPFQGNGDGVYPFFAPDSNAIYFVSSRPSYPPTRLFRSARDGAGWSAPLALDPPIYSGANEWGGSLATDGTLYFCSERAGGIGNGDIYVALTSPGGFGRSDLYISYNEGGVWTTPRNLGSPINTSQIEDGPFISPDGKFLFFNRRRAPYTAEQTEIWWVDARAVFQPEQSEVRDPGGQLGEQPILRIEPNPFGSSTTITYSMPSSGMVAVDVYDVLGRKVHNLVNASLAAGTYRVEFDAPRGEKPAAGIYYCSLYVGDKRLATTKRVSLR